ncbi:peptidase domain-containing ABC transporter [Rothia dentocariosa]|uniref:peptidase domain-containing ABC transporter n=1 Tax=Rothia dentocariosa TaxID=2047 RepID=UPI0028EB576D|nr:peptidase domain-containing ABC transporter [Rothia dentocariosa]
MEQLRDIGKPVILHWNNSHYVVLVRMRHDRVQIMDPGQGLRTISLEEAESSFSGSVLVPTPREDFEKKSRNVFKDWQFHTFFTKQMFGQYALFILLLAITYSVTFAVPMVIQHVVDAQLKGEENVVVGITAGVIAGIAGYYLVSIARAATLASIVSSIGYKLLGDLFARLLKLPLTYFALRSPGDILYRLASVNILRDFLSSHLTEFVINIGTMIVILIFIAQQSGVVLLITCGVLAVLVVIWIVTARPTSQALDAEYSHASETQVIELDAINTVATMKMTGSATSTFGKWRETYLRSLASMRRRMVLQQGVLGSAAAVVQLGGPLILLLSSLPLVNNGTLTLGQAIATEGISALLFSSISSVMFGIMNIAAVDRAVARITDIQRYEPEQDEGTVTDVFDSDIELDNVSFTYPGGMAPVLSEVSLTVPEEQDIAIVGSSGSGKSTLAMLLCSLYSPVSGAIRVGGIDIRDYSLDALRSHIGYVPQQLQTRTGSLYDNLTAGLDDGRSREEIEANIYAMGILDFVKDLPLGFDTIMANGGENFSGGQRQRIAIATALLRYPRILVLDEATSALDTTTERQVTELIAQYQCTKVVVAHRLSTIRNAQQIVVMEHGCVMQVDSHEELISVEGRYRDLYYQEEKSSREEYA